MSTLSDLNILIVDDVTTVRNMLVKTLKGLGAKNFFHADNVVNAWDQIDSSVESGSPIDIIFSDWNMPGGDGIDLLHKIRSNENSEIRFMKFIMITGADDKVLAAMDTGSHNIIHKPFTPEMIKKKLELMYGEL